MNKEKTGALIAALRKEKNMTQEELAAKLYVTGKAVSKWERGLSFPGVDLLESLAKTLDVTIVDLLAGEILPPEESVEKSGEISVSALRSDRRSKRFLFVFALLTAVSTLLLTAMLLFFGTEFFKFGNPFPYFAAAMRLSDDTPYVTVDAQSEHIKAIYISAEKECPALIDFLEKETGYHLSEKRYGGYIFSNPDSSHYYVVTANSFLGFWTVWRRF